MLRPIQVKQVESVDIRRTKEEVIYAPQSDRNGTRILA